MIIPFQYGLLALVAGGLFLAKGLMGAKDGDYTYKPMIIGGILIVIGIVILVI